MSQLAIAALLFVGSHFALSSPPFPVDHVALFESTLGGEGAHYECVERWPLG